MHRGTPRTCSARSRLAPRSASLALLSLAAATAGCASSRSPSAYRPPAPHPAPVLTMSAGDGAAELAFQQRTNPTAAAAFATVPTDR